MYEILHPFLSPGVTDIIVSSSGPLTYRQFGRWSVSDDRDAVRGLLAGLVADLRRELPELEKAIAEGRNFDFRHGARIDEQYTIRIIATGRRLDGQAAIELSVRVHSRSVSVRSSELGDIVKALGEQKTGLFFVTGGFGKSTYLNALTELSLRSTQRRAVILSHVKEFEPRGPLALGSIIGGITEKSVEQAKLMAAELVVIFDDVSNAREKYLAETLATQMVVLCAAPGGDIFTGILNWVEEVGSSATHFAQSFHGAVSVNVVGDGTRYRSHSERFIHDSEATLDSLRSVICAKNWKAVAKILSPSETEKRRDVA